MNIIIGSDHGGFELKDKLITFLKTLGHSVEDKGAFELNPQDDYPDFILPVARKVTENNSTLGIIIGRSGNGEAICANKIKGIRAAVCLSIEMARKAKKDNNANILSIGADYVSNEDAERIVETFINTSFSNEERHIRRLEKIKELEN